MRDAQRRRDVGAGYSCVEHLRFLYRLAQPGLIACGSVCLCVWWPLSFGGWGGGLPPADSLFMLFESLKRDILGGLTPPSLPTVKLKQLGISAKQGWRDARISFQQRVVLVR